MTTINGSQKQLEKDNWLSLYLPAICAATIMAVVLFVAVSCSKKDDKPIAKMSAPDAQGMNTPAPSSTPAPAPEPPKKAVKKHHRPANATYVNGTYGVSFSYPIKYTLHDDKSIPAKAKFLASEAVTVATVDIPNNAYPDTDFSGALLNVSVSSGMTAEQCEQFSASSDSKEPKPTTIKVGANSFSEVEDMGSQSNEQSDAKYFHLFKNGACYEFALSVETSRTEEEDLAQVDRGKVFQQLEKILSTARIKDVELPGVERTQNTATTDPASSADSKMTDSTKTSADSKPLPDTKSEKAQVVTPTEQK